MSISDTTRKVNELCSAWEQFKQINEQRLKDISEKGSSDVLTSSQLNKINNEIDECQSRVKNIELSMQRPISDYSDADVHENDEREVQYKSAFNLYLRKGVEANLNKFHTKALSAESESGGGYLVHSYIADGIKKSTYEGSAMRKLATVHNVSTSTLEVIGDYTNPAVSWSGTSDTIISDETSTPVLQQKEIKVRELYANPRITQQLLDDSSMNVEQWLIEQVGNAFALKEGEGFIKGDGVQTPEGILTRSNKRAGDYIERIKSGVDANLNADSLIKLYYSLKEEYISGATFLMDRTTAQLIRMLKHPSNNSYIWQPSLSAGAPDTILGIPVYQTTDMNAPATGSLSVALGNFKKGYMIVDRSDITVLRDPYTAKPMITFYITKRVGGAVVRGDAIKIMQLSA